MARHTNRANGYLNADRPRCPYVKILSAEPGERTGPGLKPAKSVPGFCRATVEVDLTVFFLQNRRKRCLIVLLVSSYNRALPQASQRLDHEIRTKGGQFWGHSFSRVFGRDGQFALQQGVARIEARINSHGGHAGEQLTPRNGPLNWCG